MNDKVIAQMRHMSLPMQIKCDGKQFVYSLVLERITFFETDTDTDNEIKHGYGYYPRIRIRIMQKFCCGKYIYL